MRVVIDTNIWISFLIGQTLAGLSEAIVADRVAILFSEELFAELITVLQRPKFKKYFSGAAIEELIALLYDRVEWIDVTQHFDECRDKKDNFLLDLSVSGRADYLVTGDEDLLILNPFHGVKIVSYGAFKDCLAVEAGLG